MFRSLVVLDVGGRRDDTVFARDCDGSTALTALQLTCLLFHWYCLDEDVGALVLRHTKRMTMSVD